MVSILFMAQTALKVGATVTAGSGSEIIVGNALPLKEMPLGSFVHNVELKPGKGGQLGRSAGSSLQLLAREGSFAQLKMSSGEIRKVKVECLATYGLSLEECITIPPQNTCQST